MDFPSIAQQGYASVRHERQVPDAVADVDLLDVLHVRPMTTDSEERASGQRSNQQVVFPQGEAPLVVDGDGGNGWAWNNPSEYRPRKTVVSACTLIFDQPESCTVVANAIGDLRPAIIGSLS